MFFYKIEAAVNSKKMRVSSDEGKAFVTSFRTAANTEWHKSKNTRLFFICNIKNGKVTVGTAETVPNDVGTAFREFVAAADILLSFVSAALTKTTNWQISDWICSDTIFSVSAKG